MATNCQCKSCHTRTIGTSLGLQIASSFSLLSHTLSLVCFYSRFLSLCSLYKSIRKYSLTLFAWIWPPARAKERILFFSLSLFLVIICRRVQMQAATTTAATESIIEYKMPLPIDDYVHTLCSQTMQLIELICERVRVQSVPQTSRSVCSLSECHCSTGEGKELMVLLHLLCHHFLRCLLSSLLFRCKNSSLHQGSTENWQSSWPASSPPTAPSSIGTDNQQPLLCTVSCLLLHCLLSVRPVSDFEANASEFAA